MKRTMLVAVLAMLLSVMWGGVAQAQTEPAQATGVLHIFVLYEKGDQDQGVGAGVVVEVRESGSTQTFVNTTNEVSEVRFGVRQTSYYVDAYPPQTRLFFRWVCSDLVLVNENPEYLILYCHEKFFLRIPFING